MTAPKLPRSGPREPFHDPGVLRLCMAHPRVDRGLDGAWWPRSRDLPGELADLVDHFPADRCGRIIRVLVSPADWNARPRHVLVGGGYVKVGFLSQDDDSHLIHLTTSHRTLLSVLVVPSEFTRDQGDAALEEATKHRDTRSASRLIERVRTDRSTAAWRASRERRISWWRPDLVASEFSSPT
ncbi:MAG: hypothetical protein AVDCRST_MAG32-1916 [uncultured Nocardioides sp.]|uniref:Uncharacterized protein n=1 Tax=uncultured Nocardioides sp. TaxID=198441 RepID=A0A6J4NDM8_9ACTN|nr:MAG: hypothetical protein AVDCRST_MAG32-1916 [uncultured Nocardioides sp.]